MPINTSKFRTLFFLLLTLLTLGLTIVNSWKLFQPEPVSQAPKSYKLTETLSLQDKIQLMQSKIVLGSLEFFENKQEAFGWPEKQVQALKSQVISSFNKGNETAGESELSKKIGFSRESLRTQIIVGQELGNDLSSLVAALEKKQLKSPLYTDTVLLELIKSKEKISVSEEKKELILEKLGWRGELLAANNLAGDFSKEKTKLAAFLEQGFIQFAFGIAFFSVFAILSVAIFSMLAFSFIAGKIRSNFSDTTIPGKLLEVFCVYMILMLSLIHI